MTDKQIIIDDQKKTIHRLQDECTEKTNVIIALGEQLKVKEQIIEKLKEKHNTMCKSCPRNISCDECSNNTTLKILNGEIV